MPRAFWLRPQHKNGAGCWPRSCSPASLGQALSSPIRWAANSASTRACYGWPGGIPATGAAMTRRSITASVLFEGAPSLLPSAATRQILPFHKRLLIERRMCQHATRDEQHPSSTRAKGLQQRAAVERRQVGMQRREACAVLLGFEVRAERRRLQSMLQCNCGRWRALFRPANARPESKGSKSTSAMRPHGNHNGSCSKTPNALLCCASRSQIYRASWEALAAGSPLLCRYPPTCGLVTERKHLFVAATLQLSVFAGGVEPPTS